MLLAYPHILLILQMTIVFLYNLSHSFVLSLPLPETSYCARYVKADKELNTKYSRDRRTTDSD
ncbi:hypothetical protein HYDPIDRAFT_112912 [Hydnomerulius pinastri MD-312]|uniref:Unplaced genomic scaffold scaffold_16, whole genome shotgun sequence n=1 Tax=Hydnomerulius pinastri MD-312 TaxID=994086 RepID=A0A0C9VD37_9AGAM|nr:hypothetical protein HYDPIDRAFT_112912 [Hydnomerulius pinastri MD-312]